MTTFARPHSARRRAGWLAALLVLVACGGSDPIDAALCTAFTDVTDPDSPASTVQRTEALQALAEALPSSRFEALAVMHQELDRGFEAAVTEQSAFDVGLRFATAMHDRADDPLVSEDVADAVRTTCPRVDVRILRGGPDAFQDEPEESTDPAVAGTVDAFVRTLVAAHDASGGQGCLVLAEELGFASGRALPHLNADTWSAEIGCAFYDEDGGLRFAVVALDGRLHPGLVELAEEPGRVGVVAGLFGQETASGVAMFDAGSDGWLVTITPHDRDPARAVREVVATL